MTAGRWWSPATIFRRSNAPPNGIGQTLITSVASLIVALAAVVPWLPVIVLVLRGRSMEFSPLPDAQGQWARKQRDTP